MARGDLRIFGRQHRERWLVMDDRRIERDQSAVLENRGRERRKEFADRSDIETRLIRG